MAMSALAITGFGLVGCESGEDGSGGAEIALTSSAAVTPAAMNGRWGLTTLACSSENGIGDGVVEFADGQVMIGLDRCSLNAVEPAEAGAARLTAQCVSGEGGDPFSVEYLATISPDGELIWIDVASGRSESYLRCTAAGG